MLLNRPGEVIRKKYYPNRTGPFRSCSGTKDITKTMIYTHVFNKEEKG